MPYAKQKECSGGAGIRKASLKKDCVNALADYTEGSELDTLVKKIILRTSANEALEAAHFHCMMETESKDQ